MLKTGSIVAVGYAVVASMVLQQPDAGPGVVLAKSLLLFEEIAVAAALLGFVIYGEDVRQNMIAAGVSGAACVAIASPLPLVAMDLYPTLHRTLWIDGDIVNRWPLADATRWDLFVVVLTHCLTLFTPEIIGAMCGYAIWRSSRAVEL